MYNCISNGNIKIVFIKICCDVPYVVPYCCFGEHFGNPLGIQRNTMGTLWECDGNILNNKIRKILKLFKF
jgi:hypothetical protein